AAGNEGPHAGSVYPLFLTTLAAPNNPPVAVDDAYQATEDTPLMVNTPAGNVLYHESFDGLADPSPLSAAGWSIVTGTANPTVVNGDFVVHDDQNVNKITTTDDAGFAFNSGHLFLEHDISELIIAGYGFGETFVYTDEVVAQNGGAPLDLNGAYMSVDYANGNGFSRGPSFQFAIRTGTSWFVAEAAKNVGPATGGVSRATLSTDPIDTTFAFVPISLSPGAYHADVRILYQDTFTRTLTASELADITAVGILTYPQGDGLPARFDNFTISTTPNPQIGVLGNDTDADGDPITAAVATGPAHGTLNLNADGTFAYSPDSDFNGVDSFTYTVSDGAATSAPATVTIKVAPVNDPPSAGWDTYW
ncbi:MAG: hypothetical protein D6741_18750, partial [Planctomycetota bacterium]